jgi:hypothetical protein
MPFLAPLKVTLGDLRMARNKFNFACILTNCEESAGHGEASKCMRNIQKKPLPLWGSGWQ